MDSAMENPQAKRPEFYFRVIFYCRVCKTCIELAVSYSQMYPPALFAKKTGYVRRSV